MNPISSLLQTIPLLRALSPSQLEQVAAICERCTYVEGDIVVKSGDPADAAYFLINGNVDCQTVDAGAMVSSPIPAGATLLELAMIIELDVSATCVARGPAKILKIPRSQMHDVMQENVALTDNVIETLTLRLEEMAQTMREASAPFESNFADQPQKISA